MLWYAVLCCFVLCCIVLYCIVLRCVVLCCVVFYCVLLYCIIATVGGSLCSVRACVHVLISILQEVCQEQPLTVKCSAKWLEKLFLPPVHSISCIDSCILSFSKENKSIYRYMSCRIVSTDKVTHRKEVIAVAIFPIVNLKKRSAFKKGKK